MNYVIPSNTFRRGLQIALLLLLGMAALGNGVGRAAGLCVHPTGAGRCFTSIQAAVDAANSGDRILIRAGNYIEQVTIIGKDLTLIGRSGAVVQAPANMADTLTPVAGVEGRPIILVAEAEVTIHDLTIDGANSAANNPFLEGIVFINAGGLIQDNLVKNIGFGAPTLPIVNGEPSFQGEGMLVVNLGAAPRTVTIAKNSVVNYNSSGITVFAQALPGDPTLVNLTAHVVDNTVIGSGPNQAIGQWGVFFGAYENEQISPQITGTLKGNRIQDLITVDFFPSPGVGIVTRLTTNLEIATNQLENVNIGLTVSGWFGQVLENRLKRADTGILLFVEDPYFGSAIGFVLDENRFEHVAMDMVTGPGMSFAMAAASAPETPSQWQRNRLFQQPLP
jgi:hypothetical protein